MDESYVIVLDSDDNSRHWIYIAERATLEETRKTRQYLSTDRREKSKEDYEGKFIEPKSVINTETGNQANGKIYKLTKQGGTE